MTLIEVDKAMKEDLRGARLPHNEKYEGGSGFVNGEYCTLDQLVVPIMDQGFFFADAVYDKATVSKGRYFRLQDHLDRFARSCEIFRLRNPYTNREMVEIFDELIRLGGLKDAGVWWCVTRGMWGVVSDRGNTAKFENRFYAHATPYGSIATAEQRARGLNLLISKKYIRIPPKAVDPTAKNFHWADMKLSLFEARDHGKDWSVLTDTEGYLTEAPGANIFVIKNGELYTPDSGGLEGITRQSVLELADTIGVRTRVGRVHAKELLDADDAFMTSSAGGVMPINSVDGIVLGRVAGPGPLTTRLHNLYWEKMWEGWKSTPVDYEGSRTAEAMMQAARGAGSEQL